MTIRRAVLLVFLGVPVAVAAYLLLHSRQAGEPVRFVLYRPAAAQFFIERGAEPGGGLDYVHEVRDTVPFGAAGDIGLACPQTDPANRAGLRTFAKGAWFVTRERRESGDFVLGQAGDLPFCADFDGDGLADSGVFRAGAWFVATRRDGAPDVRFAFGTAGDRPLVLNVLGAGNSTDRRNLVYGVYRRGMWYLDAHGTGAVGAAHTFGGLPQDLPLLIPRWSRGAANPPYSLAIFRDGTWYVKPDPDGAQTLSFAFGAAGDLPGFVR